MKDKKKIYWICFIGIVVCFIAIKIPSFFEPPWVFDEGEYAAIAHFLSLPHALLYITTWDNKPPSIYFLFLLSRYFFGYTIIPIRIFLFLIESLTFFLVFRLTHTWFGEKGKIFSLITLFAFDIFMFYDGNIVNGEVLFTFFSILSFFILSKFTQEARWWKYLLAGISMGIGISIKIPAAFDAIAFMLAYLIFTFGNYVKQVREVYIHLQYLLLYSIGCCLPLATYILYFLLNHAIGAFFNAVFFSNKGYIDTYGSFTMLFINTGIVVSITIFLAINSRKFSQPAVFIFIWAVWGYFSSLISGRGYFHYLMQLTIPASFLIAMVFSKPRILRIIPAILIFLFAQTYFFSSLAASTFSWQGTTKIVQKDAQTYTYLFGKKTKRQYEESFLLSGKLDAYNMLSIAHYLNTYVAKNNKIFIWGNTPWIYAATDLQPICVYVADYYIGESPTLQKKTLSCVKADMPQVILVQTGRYTFPLLTNLLHTFYRQGTAFEQEGILIYTKQ